MRSSSLKVGSLLNRPCFQFRKWTRRPCSLSRQTLFWVSQLRRSSVASWCSLSSRESRPPKQSATSSQSHDFGAQKLLPGHNRSHDHNRSELRWLENSGEAFAELAARAVIHCCQKCSIYLDFRTQLLRCMLEMSPLTLNTDFRFSFTGRGMPGKSRKQHFQKWFETL